MTLEECKVGTLVRAMKDLAPGFWATGLILGQIEKVNDILDLSVRFINHALHKEYEGKSYHCKPRHLVLVSNPTADAKIEIDTDLASLFE